MNSKDKNDFTQEDIIFKFHITKLEECMAFIENEIANKINNGSYLISNSYMNVVLRCVGKSILTFRELIVLCKNGFPDGALGLSRNLFEQFIIICTFEMVPEGKDRTAMVKKYCADYDVKKYKNLRIMYEYAGKDLEAQECKDAIEKLKKEFSIHRFNEYWWCGQDSFAAMCERVIKGMDGKYKTMVKNLYITYKRACLSLHANTLGNANRIGDCLAEIDLRPLDEGQEYALDLGVKSFITVVMVLYRELELNPEKANKKLNELAVIYQNMILKKEIEEQ